jgi:hypothetical protein
MLEVNVSQSTPNQLYDDVFDHILTMVRFARREQVRVAQSRIKCGPNMRRRVTDIVRMIRGGTGWSVMATRARSKECVVVTVRLQ